MRTKLFLKGKYFPISEIKILLILICLIVPSLFSNGQEISNQSVATIENVIPNAYSGVNGGNSFLGPYTNSQRTYQLLIAESELTSLVGKYLVSISFRNTSTATTEWPTTTTTYNNYDIYLSDCVNPADRSFIFAQNVVGTQTQVRTGSLDIPASALTAGSNPNSFSYDISFTTPWFYAGGNLLVEIRHDGSSGASRSVDAAGTSTSGYGTLYSACWAGSYTSTSTTTQANFAIVNFKAEDELKTTKFDEVALKVYPNPTSDIVYFNEISDLKSIKVYSVLGQILLDIKTNENLSFIDISQLNKGTYLLQFETDNALIIKKIMKK